MTDKERILLTIITRIIPGLMSCISKKEEYVKTFMLNNNHLKPGDLVYANAAIYPNEFVVGFVHAVKPDCVVIREIGSKRLCKYYSEAFSIINKEKLGYEILEGTQYKLYEKAIKAFSYSLYKFKSISFNDNVCTLQARKSFSNECLFEISFSYNSKTTIKSIVTLIEEQEELLKSN